MAKRGCCWELGEDIKLIFRESFKRKMLLVIYCTTVAQRVLNLAFIEVVSVWISEYVYDGDTSRIANHNKIVFGISYAVVMVIAPFLGIFFDRCGELVVLPLNYFIAGAPYFALYALNDLESAGGYVLQIIATIASITNNTLGFLILARHAPPVGAGKIFALNRVFSGIVQIGMSYLLGWMIDQSFNKVAFLVVGSLGIIVVITFVSIRVCCKDLAKVVTDEEDNSPFQIPMEVLITEEEPRE